MFWNPGDAFATTDELLNPTEKQVRNPAVVDAFRRIGLSEQAGTGMRAIFRNWQSLGHVPPVVENDKAKKAFELRLLREELLSEEQRLFQARLGVRLDEAQARLFAFACRRGGASLVDAKAVTGRAGPDARKALDALVVQGLLQPPAEGARYRLVEHLDGRAGALGTDQVSGEGGYLVSDQVEPGAEDMSTAHVGARSEDMSTAHVEPRPNDMSTAHDRQGGVARGRQDETLTEPSASQWRIIERCDAPRRLVELMKALGVTNRGHFKKRHLDPLLRAGLVTMTNPDNPRAAGQRYVLTEAGAALKAVRLGRPPEDERHGRA